MNAGEPLTGFREIDHSADRAVEVWAVTVERLFEVSASAMFTLMTDLETVLPEQKHCTHIEFEDLEFALIEWLNELLFWRETRGELYSQFRVILEDSEITGWFSGSPGNPTKAVIKAATFHDLHIQQDEQGLWRARIVFDT